MTLLLQAFAATLLLLSARAAHHHHQRCEKIVTPLCQNLGYNTTLMPNIIGHEDQKEATLGVSNCLLFINKIQNSRNSKIRHRSDSDPLPGCNNNNSKM